MAIIPKESKTNSFQDQNLGVEVIAVLYLLYVLYDAIFSRYIISYLQPFMVALLVMLTAYLLMPSSINKGKSGFQRIMIFVRYELGKVMEWRSKHIWK